MMWGNRKRRKEKIVKIDPLRVLHRSFMGWGYVDEYEIIELRYKVKTKPTIYDSTGEKHHIYRDSGVYYDTPKNRELLSQIQEIEGKMKLLNGEMSDHINQIEKVDVSKLHERALQNIGESPT